MAEQRDLELAALLEDLLVVGGDLDDAVRELQVRLGEQRANPVIDQLRLQRIVLVHQHVHGGGLRGGGGQLGDAVLVLGVGPFQHPAAAEAVDVQPGEEKRHGAEHGQLDQP